MSALKDLGLAIGLGGIVVAPIAILSGIAVGGVWAYKKLKEKDSGVAGEIGQEGTWDFLSETEVDYWETFA